jgi:hypothetical protein
MNDLPPKITPLKAIRLKCLECCAESSNEVKVCHMKDCPLWAFRFGKNPYRVKRQLTDEQKEKLRKQLAKGRAKQAQKLKGGGQNP